MNNKGKLIVLSGFSGSGKGTIVNRLLSDYDDYVISISATTRNPREGEKEGVSYFFRSKEQFQSMIDNDELIEYATFVGNSYGTPKEFVESKIKQGFNVILEIEVVGALKVKEKYPDCEMIFIMPPSARELYSRLKNRGTEEDEVIFKRLERAIYETDYMKSYDYIIINDDLDECVLNINDIIHGKNHDNNISNNEIIAKLKSELECILKGE